MDIASVVRNRLEELGVEQRDLALGAGVTESYISQLLAKKKTPPAPDRTDIYEKIAKILKLPAKELTRLAETQRREELKRKVLDPPRPLFQEFRQLILKKCVAARKKQITGIFEREPFGEIERFITERLFDAAKEVAKKEQQNAEWIARVAQISRCSTADTHERMRKFIETDVFHVPVENCIIFLNPLIQSWDIEMGSFRMEVKLNRRLTRNHLKRFEFREVEAEKTFKMEPALAEFMSDAKLSTGISDDEIAFLKRLRIAGRQPSVLYYYRELQNLRDPLNFVSAPLQNLEPVALAMRARSLKRKASGRGRM